MKWPLGIAAVNGGRRVLVTLDEGIVSFLPNGTSQRDWSSRGDMGFLCEGGGRILAASGGDGNVVSFDPACLGSWDGFYLVRGTFDRRGSVLTGSDQILNTLHRPKRFSKS